MYDRKYKYLRPMFCLFHLLSAEYQLMQSVIALLLLPVTGRDLIAARSIRAVPSNCWLDNMFGYEGENLFKSVHYAKFVDMIIYIYYKLLLQVS